MDGKLFNSASIATVYLWPNDGDDEKPAWFSGHIVLDGTGFESQQDQEPFLVKCRDRLWHLLGSGALSWG